MNVRCTGKLNITGRSTTPTDRLQEWDILCSNSTECEAETWLTIRRSRRKGINDKTVIDAVLS